MAGRWSCSRRGGIDYTWNWRARCVTAEYLKRLPFLFSQDFQRVFAEVRSTSYNSNTDKFSKLIANELILSVILFIYQILISYELS